MVKLSWRPLNAQLTNLSEDDLARMLEDEIATHQRPSIVRRLHQRLCTVRTMRERAEIMERIKA